MSTLAPARYAGGDRVLRIDVPACLTFVAFAALVFGPRLGSLSALLFILAGGALLATDIERSTQSILRHWYILVLPGYCLASALWSSYPGNTLYYGTQFAFTAAVSIAIATRVEPSALLRVVFVACGLGILASLLVGNPTDGTAWRGIFESKNAFAGWVAIFLFASAALATDGRSGMLMRLAAAAGVVVAIPLLMRAQSVGMIIVAGPCTLALAVIVATRYLSARYRAGLAVALVLIAVCIGLIAYAAWDEILEFILANSGKDVTLTGRTELWERGSSIIAEYPLLGVGYRGFWVVGNPAAELLWHAFGVRSGAGFGFHNTYISNAVDLGLLGLGIQIVLLYGAFILTALRVIRQPSAANAFFFALLMLIILQSFTEVAVFFEFSVPTILVFAAVIYGLRDLRLVRPRFPLRPRFYALEERR